LNGLTDSTKDEDAKPFSPMQPEGKLAMMEEEGFDASPVPSQIDREQPQPDG
jgi:hypothetical protein